MSFAQEKIIARVDQPFTVSTGTGAVLTGYQQQISYDPDHLKKVKYETVDVSDQPGAGGRSVYTFIPVVAGHTNIFITATRLWDPDELTYPTIYNVFVEDRIVSTPSSSSSSPSFPPLLGISGGGGGGDGEETYADKMIGLKLGRIFSVRGIAFRQLSTPLQRALIKGFRVELEHGSQRHPVTNVTHDDPWVTTQIALAHLLEAPNYYDYLERMEEEAARTRDERAVEEVKRLCDQLVKYHIDTPTPAIPSSFIAPKPPPLPFSLYTPRY